MTNPGSHSQGCSCLPSVLWGLDKYPQLSTSFQPTTSWEAGCLPGWHRVDAVMPSMVPRLLWALHWSWPNDNIMEEATAPPPSALRMNSTNA